MAFNREDLRMTAKLVNEEKIKNRYVEQIVAINFCAEQGNFCIDFDVNEIGYDFIEFLKSRGFRVYRKCQFDEDECWHPYDNELLTYISKLEIRWD